MSELLVLGSVNMDLVIRTPRLPIPGETVLGGVLQTFPGGKGANQSVSAAKLGASTRFLGCVGDDEFGGSLRENLLRAGVNCELLRTRAGMNSGVAFIEVDAISGENHIIVAPGANGTISPDDVHASADLLARMDALVCQLEIPMETVETAFSLASELGVLTVLNAAPMRPLSDDLLGQVDYLIVNESELAALSGMATDSETSIREAAEVLLKRGPKAVVVTLG
ncbi:MAG: ribokinase, partial [Anaerolineaceae bacterium]|nr:ribokinase [Anaerolineaceae bacterium]